VRQELVGHVRLRATAPELAFADVELDEQGTEQLSATDAVGSIPGIDEPSEPEARRRRGCVQLDPLSQEPLTLLVVLVGCDVAPLEALADPRELSVDALARRASGKAARLPNRTFSIGVPAVASNPAGASWPFWPRLPVCGSAVETKG
jgi:hypothetical protein